MTDNNVIFNRGHYGFNPNNFRPAEQLIAYAFLDYSAFSGFYEYRDISTPDEQLVVTIDRVAPAEFLKTEQLHALVQLLGGVVLEEHVDI